MILLVLIGVLVLLLVIALMFRIQKERHKKLCLDKTELTQFRQLISKLDHVANDLNSSAETFRRVRDNNNPPSKGHLYD